MPYRLLVFVFLLLSGSVYSQMGEHYSRAKIFLGSQSLQDLSALGIETDHGYYRKGLYFENDFSEREIHRIQQAGFHVEITIDDVIAYYQDPNRPSELVHRHGRTNGCDSDTPNWVTPSQYTYGSMGGYHTLDELYAVLDTMQARYPHLISAKAPIDTFITQEGRPIYWLRVSNNPTVDEDKPEVLYTALHHAREPNSLSQMLFYLWYLLENYDTNPDIQTIVNNTEMYFVPCINPDGYAYNETTNPSGGGMWRKNRWNQNGTIYGVDLNRNYAYEWGYDDSGSSPDENSDTYRGPSPASEPETQAINALCEAHSFKLALNYHTYGNLLIHPWGYSDQNTAEHSTFSALGNAMTKENNFLLGIGTANVGYVVNGDSDDWMYGDQGIYSFTPEVGPSFWPVQSDIDALNKSCILQNIVAAKLALDFVETELKATEIQTPSGQFEVEITHPGLLPGQSTISCSSLNDKIQINTAPKVFDLAHLDTETAFFDYTVNGDFDNGEHVQIIISASNSSFQSTDTIEFELWNNPVVSFFESGDSIQNWAGDWGETGEAYYSPSKSITDSPNSDYTNLSESWIRSPMLDLTSALGASVKFYAKWDIEKGWDYAQVVASGDDWLTHQPLCGQWTITGNDNQHEGQPIYDGTQEEWVLEKIDLSDFVGQKIQIGFRMVSDNFVTGDGFYFDDFQLVTYLDAVAVSDVYQEMDVQIFPNPASETVVIQYLHQHDMVHVEVVNHLGIIVDRFSSTSRDTKKELDVAHYAPGMYTISFRTENGMTYRKFIKN